MSKSKDLFMQQRESEEADIVSVETYQKLDKISLNASIQRIVHSVSEGDANSLEAFIFINWIEKVAKGAKEQLKEQAIEEAMKHGKNASVYDATVTVKSTGGKYKYPKYIKALQDQHKAAYGAAKNGGELIDKETGEVVEPAKYTPGKETIAVTFK